MNQKRSIFIFFLLFSLSLFSKEKKTICLNMIVKNEKDVIEHCLESVKPLIDYWVIVDTGSTDGTQKIIQKCLKDIPGKLYERPWVNFAHNRNEALEFAKNKGDYLLILDADEELIYDPEFTLPPLTQNFYYIQSEYGLMHYYRTQLVSNQLNWKWEGVIHEAIISDDLKTFGVLEGVTNKVRHEGARSKDPNTIYNDIKILKEALEKEPENSRYQFYLAQSYKDSGNFEEAITQYQKRIEMGGWDQEVFWSFYQMALAKELLGRPFDEIVKGYSDAYTYRPSRAEPLCRLAAYLRQHKNYFLGYLVACKGLSCSVPKDVLFVEDWVYRYGLLLEKSICAYWIGKYPESLELSNEILQMENLPKEIQDCVQKNMKYALNMVIQSASKVVMTEIPQESSDRPQKSKRTFK